MSIEDRFKELSANFNSLLSETSHLFKKEDDTKKLDLFSLDPKEVDELPLIGQRIHARIYSVYDGDTARALYEYKGHPVNVQLRILGIDTPEIKPKHPKRAGLSDEEYERRVELRALEKRAGKIAGAHVRSLLVNEEAKHVEIQMDEVDRYGRALTHVFIDHADGSVEPLCDIMIREGYARPYEGDKRHPWTKEELTSGPYKLE